jgi:hypothetical protein
VHQEAAADLERIADYRFAHAPELCFGKPTEGCPPKRRARRHENSETRRSEKIFNPRVAACAVYSLVFSAWLFMALRLSSGFHIVACGLTATILAGILAVGIRALLGRRIAA